LPGLARQSNPLARRFHLDGYPDQIRHDDLDDIPKQQGLRPPVPG
jgi:hypothetical protein